LPTSVIIDLVIIAVFVVCVVMGMKKGLFRSLAELVILIAALLAAARLASGGATLVVDRVLRPAAYDAVETRIEELLAQEVATISPMEEIEGIIDAIPYDFVRERAREYLEELDLSVEMQVDRAAEGALRSLAYEVVDTVLETMVYNLLYTVFFILVFLILNLVFRLLIRALDLPFHLPVLRQLNSFGGLLFGVGKGVLLIWLGLWAADRTGLMPMKTALEGTYILPFVLQWSAQAGFPIV